MTIFEEKKKKKKKKERERKKTESKKEIGINKVPPRIFVWFVHPVWQPSNDKLILEYTSMHEIKRVSKRLVSHNVRHFLHNLTHHVRHCLHNVTHHVGHCLYNMTHHGRHCLHNVTHHVRHCLHNEQIAGYVGIVAVTAVSSEWTQVLQL